jgi:MoaA/NifB/PqqE/SkfB family radical SAM enzyme
MELITMRSELRNQVFSNLVKVRSDLRHPRGYLEKVILKLLFRRKRDYVPWMPRDLFIGTESRCNLRCEMCANWLMPKEQHGSMSFQGFRRILDQFKSYQTNTVIFAGEGEPFLNPDLIRMMKYAKNRRFTTEIFTNGTLINRSNVKDLVANLNQMRFSVDGAKKETYEAIRKGANFENTMNKISLFIKTKKDCNSKVVTHIDFVYMTLNRNEIVDIVSLAHKLGVDNVNITMVRKMFPGKHIAQYDEKIKDLKVESESVPYLLKKASILSKRLGMGFSVTPSKPFASRCDWPWMSCFISHDGFSTPCCLSTHPDVINFGNLFETPFSEIWNNPSYRAFRRNLMSGDLPNCCKECGT